MLRLSTVVRVAAAGTAAAVTAGLLVATPAAARPADAFQPLSPQAEHVVNATRGTAVPYAEDPAADHALKGAPAAPAWPAAGVATVALPAAASAHAAAAPARVGTLPVAVGRAAHGSPTAVQVRVLDRAQTAKAWPDAVLMRIGRADGGTASAPVQVAVDTAKFRTAYGGDWAQRLHLAVLPECALTTPGAPACRGTVLPSRNSGGTVSAAVAAGSGDGTLVALTATASGGSGSFTATSLAASGTWEAGGSAGDFSWSYNLRVPPSLGGPQPQLTLSYSAQSVDGEMAASNNQPSWIGEGWQMWSGYVERSYKGCSDDMGGTANNTTKTGDLCWGTNNATLNLGGKTVELIRDDATGAWHPKSDDGSRVEHLTGASNGDNDGEYWKVTTANGTQYWFGLNRLPGWASGKPVTNSTWTEPVFGNNDGEPCHQSTFDASFCDQAWRWNLDYVVDPHGNSMSYWYGTETNKYGRDLDSTKVSSYVRGGYLTEIDYGTRTGAEFGNAPMRVRFTVADRCVPNTTCDSAHPSNWPDVPWDQSCTGSTCTQTSPTFFTTKRLASVMTQVWGGSAYRDVESWTLHQTYPDPGDGTRAGLWLASLSHTGLVGGTATVPDISFTGVQLPNRVDTLTDGAPAMNWWRIASIRTESGGEIAVQYSAPDCVAGSRMPSSPQTNTLRCYPVIWTPAGDSSPITDYFNKYVVTSVSEIDHTGGAPRAITRYTYQGTPAWHYTDDDGLTPASRRTWSQWRGYGSVAVTKGDPGAQSYGVTTYFRGMNGDHLPSGTRTASVTDTFGGSVPDSDALAGQAREEITYNGPGGAVVSDVLTDIWQSAPSASRTINGVTEYARYTAPSVSDQRIALDGGRGWREIKSVTSYDQYGAKSQVQDYGDAADPTDDQCTQYTYARNTSAWLLTYVSRALTYAGSCGTAPTAADQIVGDARTSYDGQAWGVAPTKGDVTRVEALADWTNGNPTYLTKSTSGYDAYGRVTDTTDALGNHTTTAYTPASGGPVTQTATTNPLGWVTTTTLEPAWGATTATVDPNGRRTDVTYDPLGRTSGVWLPGRVKGTQTASSTYSYLIRTDGPTTVTTNTLGPNGNYLTSYALYDGLLRPRQTQRAAVGPDGGIVATDTFYDTAGRAYKTNADYVVDGTPGTTLLVPTDNQIAAQTVTLFDGSDRPIAAIFNSFGAEKWRTTTSYGGDHTDVTPPAGGIATSTVTDGRGRTIQLRQYHGSTPSGAYDATTYTYNARGEAASVVDPAGNTWSYRYDARGRQTSATDPDKGTTTTTYDDADRVTSTVDARGQKLTYTYDTLNRKTGEYTGTTQLAGWTFDTLAKGQLTSSTRYLGANAYTTAVTGYDPQYRPTGTKVTIPASEGALAGTYQFSSTYKPDGSVSTLTMPAAGGLPAEVLGYTYTDTGQLATLSGTDTYLTQAQYTRFGEPAVYTLSTGGNIAQIGYYYDEATRRLTRTLDVRQTAPSTIADVNLTWDPAGNVTRQADAASGDTQCYSYDYQRRLTQAWTPSTADCTAAPSTSGLGGPAPYWQSYTYDTIGNRTQLVDHAANGDTTTTYAYPAAGSAQPHTLSSTTTTNGSGTRTVAYTYDDAGDTTTRPTATGTQTMSWDAEGHLATVTDTAGTGTASYVYDADGARLVAHDSTGATLYLPGMEVHASTAGTTSCTRYYTAGAATIAQRTGTGVTWLMADRQGTGQVAVDAASQTVTERWQKPFGDPRGTVSTWVNPHGYVNGLTDPDGLTHLGAREYDPAAGRFISSDPVFDSSDPQQMASYAYAGNTPITASDPSGRRFIIDDFGGGGSVGSFTPTSSPQAPSPQPAPPRPAPPKCSGWFGCAWNAVTNVVHTAVNWADQHKAVMAVVATAASIVATVAVGAACEAVTAGAGSVGCAMLAGAVGSVVSDGISGNIHSWGDALKSAGTGAVLGLAGFGIGKVLGAGVKAFKAARTAATVVEDSTEGAEAAANVVEKVKPLDPPDEFAVVRGGTNPMPPAGEEFSAAAGPEVEDAAGSLKYGSIRTTTAGEIRAGGGTVTRVPEPVGVNDPRINYRHVNVTLGDTDPFSELKSNPIKKVDRAADKFLTWPW
jgi:RHS repeat-associated protein